MYFTKKKTLLFNSGPSITTKTTNYTMDIVLHCRCSYNKGSIAHKKSHLGTKISGLIMKVVLKKGLQNRGTTVHTCN